MGLRPKTPTHRNARSSEVLLICTLFHFQGAVGGRFPQRQTHKLPDEIC